MDRYHKFKAYQGETLLYLGHNGWGNSPPPEPLSFPACVSAQSEPGGQSNSRPNLGSPPRATPLILTPMGKRPDISRDPSRGGGVWGTSQVPLSHPILNLLVGWQKTRHEVHIEFWEVESLAQSFPMRQNLSLHPEVIGFCGVAPNGTRGLTGHNHGPPHIFHLALGETPLQSYQPQRMMVASFWWVWPTEVIE